MGMFDALVTGGLQASMSADPNNPAVWSDYNGVMTAAGFKVDAEGARKISAWYRGRDILATSLAMLPLHVYRKLPNDGGREVATSHPLEDILHRKPAPGTDSFQYRRQAMFDLIDHGWFFAEIVSGPRGFVDALPRIDPTTVTPEMITSGQLKGEWKFTVRDPKTGGLAKVYRQDQMFYLRGAEGKGILQYARDSLGLGLVLDNYASKIFSRGSLNAGYVQTPGAMPDEEQMRRFARQFITASGDWHFPKVLPFGASFAAGQALDPEKAQMLLSRKFSVVEAARWLGLPAHMLNEVDTAGVTGLEQKGQEFVTFNMGGWLSLWEFGINDQLILVPQTYFAEFTREALVRGNLEARSAADVAYVNAGIETADEVRVRNNKPKMGGKASELREPQNITGRGAYGGPQDNQRPGRTGDGKAQAIVTESAARILRKETTAAQRAAVKFAGDPVAWRDWVTEFYATHHTLVMESMLVDEPTARGYVALQRDELLVGGIGAIESWGPGYLAALALDQPKADYMPGLLMAAIERPMPEAPVVQVPVTIAKGAIEVHPAAVHAAPVTVTAPITIEAGAISHTTQIAAAEPHAFTVEKAVTRGAAGVEKIVETHTPTRKGRK